MPRAQSEDSDQHHDEQHRGGHAQQRQQRQQAGMLVRLSMRAGRRIAAQALVDARCARVIHTTCVSSASVATPSRRRMKRTSGLSAAASASTGASTRERADAEREQDDDEARGGQDDARHHAVLGRPARRRTPARAGRSAARSRWRRSPRAMPRSRSAARCRRPPSRAARARTIAGSAAPRPAAEEREGRDHEQHRGGSGRQEAQSARHVACAAHPLQHAGHETPSASRQTTVIATAASQPARSSATGTSRRRGGRARAARR